VQRAPVQQAAGVRLAAAGGVHQGVQPHLRSGGGCAVGAATPAARRLVGG
jgi:hypothetical protein